ncbi:hypothetical protein TcWFU_009984 [Taenia crassiceps]|uniref:Uncharacterized protein n=1 Tax=Taenia crassiceps TaxID=6207 RepID=A0ABR4QC71_9CEST
MARHAVLILAALLTVAFHDVASRTIAVVKGKPDNERELFSNASTTHVKSKEVGATIKPRNSSITALADVKKEEEEVKKENLLESISNVVVQSANETVRPRYEAEEDRYIRKGDVNDEEVEESIGDVSEKERDAKLGKILWILHHSGSTHGRRSDSEELGFGDYENDNGSYGLKRKLIFYEDEEGVGANDKEVEDDIDFDDIEDDKVDTQEVDEDQEDMEDLEGTVVKDNNGRENADDNDESKRGNGNHEDADDSDDGGEGCK